MPELSSPSLGVKGGCFEATGGLFPGHILARAGTRARHAPDTGWCVIYGLFFCFFFFFGNFKEFSVPQFSPYLPTQKPDFFFI